MFSIEQHWLGPRDEHAWWAQGHLWGAGPLLSRGVPAKGSCHSVDAGARKRQGAARSRKVGRTESSEGVF